MFYLEYTTNFCGLTFVCRPFIRVYFKIYLRKVNISTTKRWNSVELSTDVKVALFNYVIIKSIMLLFLFGIAFCLSLLATIISRNSKALVLMWCMCIVRCVELGRVQDSKAGLYSASGKTVQKVSSLLLPEAGKAFRCIVQLISAPEYINDILYHDSRIQVTHVQNCSNGGGKQASPWSNSQWVRPLFDLFRLILSVGPSNLFFSRFLN